MASGVYCVRRLDPLWPPFRGPAKRFSTHVLLIEYLTEWAKLGVLTIRVPSRGITNPTCLGLPTLSVRVDNGSGHLHTASSSIYPSLDSPIIWCGQYGKHVTGCYPCHRLGPYIAEICSQWPIPITKANSLDKCRTNFIICGLS